MTEIMSFIGERVPSETDNMPSVGATESDAIFEQFPDFVVQFDKFHATYSGEFRLRVSLIEIIKG